MPLETLEQLRAAQTYPAAANLRLRQDFSDYHAEHAVIEDKIPEDGIEAPPGYAPRIPLGMDPAENYFKYARQAEGLSDDSPLQPFGAQASHEQALHNEEAPPENTAAPDLEDGHPSSEHPKMHAEVVYDEPKLKDIIGRKKRHKPEDDY